MDSGVLFCVFLNYLNSIVCTTRTNDQHFRFSRQFLFLKNIIKEFPYVHAFVIGANSNSDSVRQNPTVHVVWCYAIIKHFPELRITASSNCLEAMQLSCFHIKLEFVFCQKRDLQSSLLSRK